MKDEKHKCPACGSPDTISYWTIKEGKTLGDWYKQHYPNARKCVDCQKVWW